MTSYWSCDLSSANKSRRGESKREMTGGIEEHVRALCLDFVEYTVEYVCRAQLYCESSEPSQVITSFSEGVIDDY